MTVKITPTTIRGADQVILSLQGSPEDGKLYLTPEEVLDLFERLTGILPNLILPALLPYADTPGTLQCPHCAAVHPPDAEVGPVVEHDADIRWNAAGLSTPGGGTPILHIDQGQTEHATMAWVTTCCSKLVSVPADVDITWS